MLELLRRKEPLPRFYTTPTDGESDAFTKEEIPINSLPVEARDTLDEGRTPDEAKAFVIPGLHDLSTYVVLKTWREEGKEPSRRAFAVDIVGGKRVADTTFNVFGNERVSAHMGVTVKEFERRGLAERRAIILNEIVEDEWDTTLVSAPNVDAGQGEAVWQKMVERKLATAETVGGVTRYTFIPSDERHKSV